MFVAIKRAKAVSPAFLRWLGDAIARTGLSPNGVALEAGVDTGQFSKALRGVGNLSDGILEKIAPVLGMSAPDLVARATADRWGNGSATAEIGPAAAPVNGVAWTADEQAVLADLARLDLRLPWLDDEAFRGLPPEERAAQFAIARMMVAQAREAIRQQREQLARLGVIHIMGEPEAPEGKRALSHQERKAVRALWASNGRTWDGLGLDYVWDLPKSERLAELKTAAADAVNDSTATTTEGEGN